MDKEYKKMLQHEENCKEFKWTDDELLNLPEKYTKLMVHIALKKANKDKDEKNFQLILNGDGKFRRFMLLKLYS